MFLSFHMIFSLDRAAVVWTILERMSGFDLSLEMADTRYLNLSTSSSRHFDLYLEAICVVCHNFCFVWIVLHLVHCGGSIEKVCQDVNVFFLFCTYDNVIRTAEVGNKLSSDDDTTFMANVSHMRC